MSQLADLFFLLTLQEIITPLHLLLALLIQVTILFLQFCSKKELGAQVQQPFQQVSLLLQLVFHLMHLMLVFHPTLLQLVFTLMLLQLAFKLLAWFRGQLMVKVNAKVLPS